MLLAEIHGKSGEEDLLTSAVFGHLRDVRDLKFWNCLFSHVRLVGSQRTSLAEALNLKDCGFKLLDPVDFEILFWPRSKCNKNEPDLVLRFKGTDGRYLVMIVEVKLDSPKSGNGDKDQLKSYFDLLHSEVVGELNGWLSEKPEIALVYLTKHYSGEELRKSVNAQSSGLSTLALRQKRMFALRWHEVLEAARKQQGDAILRNPSLHELISFFEWRGLVPFDGFNRLSAESKRKTVGNTPLHSVSYRFFSDLDAWMDSDGYGPLLAPAYIEMSRYLKDGIHVVFREYARSDVPNEVVGIYILFSEDGDDTKKAAILAAKFAISATGLVRPRGYLLNPHLVCPEWNNEGSHQKEIRFERARAPVLNGTVIIDRLTDITNEFSVMSFVRQLLPG